MSQFTKKINDAVWSIREDDGIGVRLVGSVEETNGHVDIALEFDDADSLHRFARTGEDFKDTVASITDRAPVRFKLTVQNRAGIIVPPVFR